MTALTLVALSSAACQDDEPYPQQPLRAGTIDVKLQEWSITRNPSSAPPGTVTFHIENRGRRPHQFVLIRTDTDPDGLPVLDDGRVDEAQLDIAGKVEEEELQPGDTATLRVDLDRASYVLLCNIVAAGGLEGSMTTQPATAQLTEQPMATDKMRTEADALEVHYRLGMRVAFSASE
jgi:hypothetical protein